MPITSKWTASIMMPCEKEIEQSSVLEHQRILLHSRSETALFKQCPAVTGSSLPRTIYPRAVSLRGAASRRDGELRVGESHHGDAADEQRMAMKSSTARQRVRGEGSIPRRHSKQMAREPCPGERVSEWRGSYLTARQ